MMGEDTGDYTLAGRIAKTPFAGGPVNPATAGTKTARAGDDIELRDFPVPLLFCKEGVCGGTTHYCPRPDSISTKSFSDSRERASREAEEANPYCLGFSEMIMSAITRGMYSLVSSAR
jgi:hypothetical protein